MKNNLKFGIIGFGSVGQRHAKNLISLGIKNIILLRKIGLDNKYKFKEFVDFDSFLHDSPDAIIVANPTSLHADYLNIILSSNINVLVEKPVVSNLDELRIINSKLCDYKGIGMTAFNMRYHPCIDEVKSIIKKKELGKIFSTRFFVGQYLPDWRTNTDYSKSYSASFEMGGGVLFDLIHEIDLAVNLMGQPEGEIFNIVKKLSNLKINSEDLVELLYFSKKNIITSIHLDYLYRGYKRYIEIIAEKGSLRADLFRNKISININGKNTIEKFFQKFEKNDMYLNMLSSFIDSLKKSKESPLSLEEGLISNRIAIDLRNKYYRNISI